MQNTELSSKGKWLPTNKAYAAMGLNNYTFNKIIPELKTRVSGPKKRTEYFIPFDKMIDKFKNYYSNSNDGLDEDAAQVEEILGDVTGGQISEDDLIAARFENIKARTKVLEQQLEAKKKQMFSEWTEKFYEVFSDSFARFKNSLIDLHLNEEQISTLESKLELALKTMQDKLAMIETDWMIEDEENN